jgi:hypothetical protein
LGEGVLSGSRETEKEKGLGGGEQQQQQEEEEEEEEEEEGMLRGSWKLALANEFLPSFDQHNDDRCYARPELVEQPSDSSLQRRPPLKEPPRDRSSFSFCC